MNGQPSPPGPGHIADCQDAAASIVTAPALALTVMLPEEAVSA